MPIDRLAKPVDTSVSPMYIFTGNQSCYAAYSLSLFSLPEPVNNNYGDHISMTNKKNTVLYCISAILTIFAQLVSRFKSLHYLATSSTRKKNSWPWDKAWQNRRQFDLFARILFTDIVRDPLSEGGMLTWPCSIVFGAISLNICVFSVFHCLCVHYVYLISVGCWLSVLDVVPYCWLLVFI